MELSIPEPTPVSETFGQDASFRLEQPIGSMSISPSGRDVVLASREGLHIIDLDSPWSLPRHLPHRTPWEVADVQWSPFAARDYWIVSTSNQKALVWNVAAHGWRDAIEIVLHGHSRALTDINFSAHHPDMLATCAVDSFVHGWDLRAPARPAFSFSDWFAGATQVKWSRLDEHVVASSHDRFLHIWDKRKGAYPARTIEAHGTKIYGVDWNRFEPTKIVTCSLDKTIKFWDISKSTDTPDRVIETKFPVWRARHTPFGWGLLVMPQRGDSDLHLYDRRSIDGVTPSGHAKPLNVFKGHKGQVKEFLWRSQGSVSDGIDHRDFQLVSWGTDRELRLHSVAEETFHGVGYEKGVSGPQRLNHTRRGARYRTFRDGLHEPYSPSEFPVRSDSFPMHSQFLHPRTRYSTNIGMSKVHVAQFRGWLHGGRRERRTGMHGKGTVRPDMNPIAWMRNVKIASWDHDSLADEITQVGEKFRKVEFELVDIRQRKAVMSLQGPWGDAGAMVYLRVEFRFPKAYPRDACAVAALQKSSSVETNLHRLLSTEIHTIAETFASRQRGCIEAIIRYLLYEQTLEQIVSLLLGDNLTDSKILDEGGLPDDLSSDSDDENMAEIAGASDSSANIRVPLAKLCGALWSNDGQLVCFFPNKSREPASLLTGLRDNMLEDSQSGRLFEGFGRLQTDSPARKPQHSTLAENDNSESDSSDAISTFSSSSSSLSSSSSSSSEAGAIIRDGFATYREGIGLNLPARSRSAERSNKSTTIDGTTAMLDPRENFVSIHRFDDLLPAKKDLAKSYIVTSNGSDACTHNANIAEAAGLSKVSSVWRLAALLLRQCVPLEVIPSDIGGRPDIVVIAQGVVQNLAAHDGDTDSWPRADVRAIGQDLKGDIRWGNSPLASTYLVTAIFAYFEKMADIQSLALLSCIFLQAQSQNNKNGITHDISSPTSSLERQRHSYFPSAGVAASAFDYGQSRHNKWQMDFRKPLLQTNSENHLSIPAPSSNHHRRLTGRSDTSVVETDILRGSNRDARAVHDVSRETAHHSSERSTPLATSPQDSRTTRRSAGGSNFAASRASLSALAQTYGRSPPSGNSTAASSLKKPSPSTSLAAGTWSGTLFGREPANRGTRTTYQPGELMTSASYSPRTRSSISSVNMYGSHGDSRRSIGTSRGRTESDTTTAAPGNTKRERPQKKKLTTRIKLYNQNKFDVDGYANRPLLDQSLMWKYTAYQTSYARLLEVWEFWNQRAEILQGAMISVSDDGGTVRRILDKKSIDLGVTAVRCCRDCGNTLQAIYRNMRVLGWHCTSGQCLMARHRVSKSQICAICQKVMRGLMVPCLQCGHISCYECARTWFGDRHLQLGRHVIAAVEMVESTETEDENSISEPGCPTGCGCSCTMAGTIEVPQPAEPKLDDEQTMIAVDRRDSLTLSRHPSAASNHSAHKKRHEAGPDTALGSIMALQSRSRAQSTTKEAMRAAAAAIEAHETQQIEDELMPWASARFAGFGLGKGIGGGLSRGLSARSSETTIRKL